MTQDAKVTSPGGARSPMCPVTGGSVRRAMYSLTLLLVRASLGLYVLLAGVAKIRGGVPEFYRNSFEPLRPSWVPEAFGRVYGHAIPFLELLVGALLILGLLGRLTAFLTALMILSFTLALIEAGAFFKGPGPFHANVIMVAVLLLLSVIGSGGISVDGRRRKPRVGEQ